MHSRPPIDLQKTSGGRSKPGWKATPQALRYGRPVRNCYRLGVFRFQNCTGPPTIRRDLL